MRPSSPTCGWNCALLEQHWPRSLPPDSRCWRPRKRELERVNAELWDIEDRIREHEAQRRFDAGFIELARAVYLRNDERAAIKQRINLKLDSALIEEKSYRPYRLSVGHRSALQRVLGAAVGALGEAGGLDRQIHARMRIPQAHVRHGTGQRQVLTASPCTDSGRWRSQFRAAQSCARL